MKKFFSLTILSLTALVEASPIRLQLQKVATVFFPAMGLARTLMTPSKVQATLKKYPPSFEGENYALLLQMRYRNSKDTDRVYEKILKLAQGDINERDEKGRTFFYRYMAGLESFHSDAGFLEMFEDFGVDFNAIDTEGTTPLMAYFKRHDNNDEKDWIILPTRTKHYDWNIKDKQGLTALYYLLMHQGRDNTEEILGALRCFSEKKVDFYTKDCKGRSLLQQFSEDFSDDPHLRTSHVFEGHKAMVIHMLKKFYTHLR